MNISFSWNASGCCSAPKTAHRPPQFSWCNPLADDMARSWTSVTLPFPSPNLFNLFLSDRTWRFECNKANIALLQMRRSLSNRLEAGLNTRLTKTLRGESLIPWWICAVRSTTKWLGSKYVRSLPFYIVQQSLSISQCVPCILYITICICYYHHRPSRFS